MPLPARSTLPAPCSLRRRPLPPLPLPPTGQAEAAAQWEAAAALRGDFQSMAVCEMSEQSAFSALALRRLGREGEAEAMLQALLAYATRLASAPAAIDFFATSLPTMCAPHGGGWQGWEPGWAGVGAWLGRGGSLAG